MLFIYFRFLGIKHSFYVNIAVNILCLLKSYITSTSDSDSTLEVEKVQKAKKSTFVKKLYIS